MLRKSPDGSRVVLASQLLVLVKCPGVCPIRIGKVSCFEEEKIHVDIVDFGSGEIIIIIIIITAS